LTPHFTLAIPPIIIIPYSGTLYYIGDETGPSCFCILGKISRHGKMIFDMLLVSDMLFLGKIILLKAKCLLNSFSAILNSEKGGHYSSKKGAII